MQKGQSHDSHSRHIKMSKIKKEEDDKRKSGSRNTSPPLDIATSTTAEQETERNVGLARISSQLSISSKPESQNYLSALSQSLRSSSFLANISLPPRSPDAQLHYQEHENEDAMQYWHSNSGTPTNESPDDAISRETGAKREVEAQEDDNSPKQQLSENENLPLSQQAIETEENRKEELVFTKDYSSDSLISAYLEIIQSKSEANFTRINSATDTQDLHAMRNDDLQNKTQPSCDDTSADVNESDILFTMDDDPGSEDVKEGSSPTPSFNRLPLNFDDDQSAVKPTLLSRSQETVSSSEMKDEVSVVKTPPVKLDQADQHREPTAGLEATPGNHTISTKRGT